MTVTLQCKIVFPANDRRKNEIVIYKVNAIEVESSYKELTSRASLTLPRNVGYFNKHKVGEVFRRGDEVIVSFGYGENIVEEFTGYISHVSADIPIVISFEDEMFKVKNINVNFSHSNTSLENLLKEIIPGYTIDCLEGVQLGAVKLAKTKVGPVLEKLKSDWGLYTFMRGKTIVCGKYFGDKSEINQVKFDLERNCVATGLTYQKKDDISLKIKVVSTLQNGTKIEVDNIGDADGSERQLTYYNIESKEELERLGRIDYEKYKQDRFEGSFTAFGVPAVKHGMRVQLTSTLYEDRKGIYYVEKVVKSFDIGGIRQEITVGEKSE